jgi:hypothetical protein
VDATVPFLSLYFYTNRIYGGMIYPNSGSLKDNISMSSGLI